MNHLSSSILSAAILASAANAAACVDSVLVDVFDYINECRTAVTCAAGTDYADNLGSIADGE
jgi:opacity protein-like surface antigen